MKKNILFIFLFLIFPLSVYADTMELNCSSNDNKQILCEMTGNSENTITEIKFKITSSESITVSTVNINKSWKIVNNDDGDITITNKGVTNTFIIGEIIFNVSEETGHIGIESIAYKDNEGKENFIEDITKNIPLTNDDDSRIKKLIIDNYLVNFRPYIYEYTLKIKNEDSLKITAIPEYEDTKYTVLKNHNLVNDSEIEIITNSVMGKTTTYKIKIIKEVKPDYQKYLYVFVGIVVLIVIINIIRIISDRKNK